MRGLARRTLPSASLQLVTSRTEPKKQTRRGRRLRQRREERPAGRARIAGCAAARCARHINFLPRARIAVGDLRFSPIGAGVAGLRAAIELASAGRVLVVAKDTLRESSSEYAQGGIAVALSDDDEVELHEQDTLAGGDGLCNPAAVRTLVEEGPPPSRSWSRGALNSIKSAANWHSRARRPLAQSRAARARRSTAT